MSKKTKLSLKKERKLYLAGYPSKEYLEYLKGEERIKSKQKFSVKKEKEFAEAGYPSAQYNKYINEMKKLKRKWGF